MNKKYSESHKHFSEFFFYIPQKKESHTDFKWLESDENYRFYYGRTIPLRIHLCTYLKKQPMLSKQAPH